MIQINIAKEFAETPGARYYSDGPKSGEEFFDVLLKKKFNEAIENKIKLKIILDGTDGFASSFLNEAFRRLAEAFGQDLAWNNLFLVSEEVPKYIQKIKEAIYETQK